MTRKGPPVIILAVLLLLSALALAEDSQTQKLVSGAEQKQGQLELVKDWRALSAAAIIISVILVGLAYMAGVGLDIKELRAWGAVELNQIIVTAVIIIVMMAVIALLDTTLAGAVNYARLSRTDGSKLMCTPADSKLCAIQAAEAYLGGMGKTMETTASGLLEDSVDAARFANARVSAYCSEFISPIPCLFLTVSMGIPGQAQRMLDVEMNTLLLEWYQNLLASLYAQEFFVSQISYNIGPMLLMLGIVARSFFVTRKAGGLLIAGAVGIMFVFPAMYAFDWMTLNVALFGDDAFPSDSQSCPVECQASPPVAYYYSGSKLIQESNYTKLEELVGKDGVKKISKGTDATVSIPASKGGGTIYSCIYQDTHTNVKNESGKTVDCLSSCRELPYPSSLYDCGDRYMQEACAAVKSECKVTRKVTVDTASEKALNSICPDACKTIPSLKSDCRSSEYTIIEGYKDEKDITAKRTCLDTSWNCRVAIYDDNKDTSFAYLLTHTRECNRSQACARSLTATDTCVDILPYWEPRDCEEACEGCPAECRIVNAKEKFGETLPIKAYSMAFYGDYKVDCYAAACTSCPAGCKLDAVMLDGLNDSGLATCAHVTATKGEEGMPCYGCPAHCRIQLPTGRPPYGCPVDKCNYVACPLSCKRRAPATECQVCLESPESYNFKPAVYKDCAGLCNGRPAGLTVSPDEYARKSQDGMYGPQAVKTVGSMLIPAYLLPLVNILVTVMFIRGFSGILGGDVEIPGLPKVL